LVSAEALTLAQTVAGTLAINPKVIGAALLVLVGVGAAVAVLTRPLFTPQASTALTADRFRREARQPAKQPDSKKPARVWAERSTLSVSKGSVRVLALGPGGKQLATLGSPSNQGGRIPGIDELLQENHPKLWDTTSGKRLKVFSEERPMDQISSLAFAPDGKTLATAELGVTLWDVATGTLKATFPEPVSVAGVVFSPNGKTLALARADGVIRFCDLGNGFLTTLPKTVANLSGAAFNPDSKRLITVSFDGKVQVWDAARPTLRATHQVGRHTAPRVLSRDGKMVAAPVATPGDASIQVWDVATTKLKATLTPEDELGWINALTFAPDGKTLALGNSSGIVTLWDLATRKERTRLMGLKGRVTALVFAPDGQSLAGGDPEGTVKIWHFDVPRRNP
jgi:WD40 repeat protein